MSARLAALLLVGLCSPWLFRRANRHIGGDASLADLPTLDPRDRRRLAAVKMPDQVTEGWYLAHLTNGIEPDAATVS